MRICLVAVAVVAAALSNAQFSTTVTPDVKEAAKKQEADPKVDRSGEAKLKALFAKYGSFKEFHVSAVRFDNSDSADLTKNGDLDFYRAADGRWRLETSSVFGGAFLAVGGKDAVLVDQLDSRPQIVLDPAPTLDGALAVPAVSERAVPLMTLFAGTDSFDKYVQKSSPVTYATKDGVEAFEYKNPRGQVVRLTVIGGTVQKSETLSDYGKTVTGRDFYRLNTKPKFSEWTFDATPDKAVKLEDRRKKKGQR